MKSFRTIKAFSLIELSITVLIIGVITIVALNGKSLVVKANCVASSFGSKTITDNLNNPIALTKNRSTIYENCINNSGQPSSSGCMDDVCTSCKTTLAANPGIASGSYVIDPDLSGATQPFNAYCDMNTDGGGWTKILHYKDTAYTPNTGAVNPTSISTENTAAISGFAKLSDAQINSIGGSGVTKTYRISGGETGGFGYKKYFTKSNANWNDTSRGFGITSVMRQSCSNTDINNCTWINLNPSVNIDSRTEGVSAHYCDHYFADSDSNYSCYNPYDINKRCFNYGSSCLNNKIVSNLEIYLRE